MGTRDPRIDAYIATVPHWSKPILTRLREIVHEREAPGVRVYDTRSVER